MRFGFGCAALFLVFAIPALVWANDKPLDLAVVRTQQAEIHAGVEAHSSGRYKELPAATRSELLARQEKMLILIDGKKSADELTQEQKTAVVETLTWIDAQLNAAADERLICERRQILGSTRKERVCKTAGQLRAERDAAHEQMDRRGVCADCRSN